MLQVRRSELKVRVKNCIRRYFVCCGVVFLLFYDCEIEEL